jgi:hypothetical protein
LIRRLSLPEMAAPLIRRLSLPGLVLAGLLAPAAALASEGPSRVAVVLPSCAPLPFEKASLIELLSIELRADGVEHVEEADTQSTAVIRVELPACDAARVVLVLEDRATGKTVGRGVELGAIEPAARPRFLALSAAELLRASWLELLVLRPSAQDSISRAVRARVSAYLPPRAPLPDPAASAPAAPRPAAPPEPPSWSLSLGAATRGYPSVLGGLFGGVIGARWAHPNQLLLVDAHALHGDTSLAIGSIAMTQLSLGGAWLLRSTPGPVSLGVGPRVEAGLGQASGHATLDRVVASTQRHAVVSASLCGLVTGSSIGSWSPWLAVDAGYTLVGLTALADDRREIGLFGAFLEASLGFSR